MKRIFVMLLTVCALYTRLVGISWGLPYPMHPDERNMATAVQTLDCRISNFQPPTSNLKECLNPHFFAYGQLPLYLAYFIIQAYGLVFHGTWTQQISFEAAMLALRLISVAASWGTLLVIYRLLKDFFSDLFDKNSLLAMLFLFVFTPYAIQFAHFGTTESLLMFLYVLLTYLSMRIVNKERVSLRLITVIGIIEGLAIGIKISSATFLLLPISLLVWKILKDNAKLHRKMWNLAIVLSLLGLLSGLFTLISSPHIVLSWNDFMSSMYYESNVAGGALPVFYTRQFLFSIPILYQLTNIFPVALGMGLYVLFGLGFFLLPIKDKRYNILRLAILLYFIPSSILYVKWTRFVAPILPIMSIFGALVLGKIRIKKVLLLSLIIILVIPGIAYVSVYENGDVRFIASRWMYEHIPSSANILSEAGNVINIPIGSATNTQQPTPNYNVNNFDFYSVDSSKELQDGLVNAVKTAEYIIVPSRRVVGSVTCLLGRSGGEEEQMGRAGELEVRRRGGEDGYTLDRCEKLKKLYPVTNEYYGKLFSGVLGFAPLQTFTSFPKIELFGKTLVKFPDEQFDETWSVFDHPVIRIYKRQ